MTDVRTPLSPLLADPERAALIFDVDGTLAPIVLDPAAAIVPPATAERLVELSRRYGVVACLSGRRALDARRVVGIDGILYVGNHGLELLPPRAQRSETDPAAVASVPAVREFALHHFDGAVEQLGVRLEDKESIWSFHFRGAPDEVRAKAALEGVAEAARDAGLVPHWGRKVLEIRPPVKADKGTGLARILHGAGLRAALYAGDDTTDLDAFRKLRELRSQDTLEHAVCVGVQSAEAPPSLTEEADVVVEGPDGLASLLATLAN